jgi:dephospho-CoA kinase
MTSNNPNKQNLSKCIEMADYVFNNDKDFSYLYNQIENVLKKIRHS